MKLKICLLVISTFMLHNAFASILLVNNTAGGPGQYTQINDAVIAATAGDTIYVSGSAIAYNAAVNINKSITMVGPGTFTQKDMQFAANTRGFAISDGTTNVNITGFSFTLGNGGPFINIGLNASSIKIYNNYFTNACCANNAITITQCHDLVIENNVFNLSTHLIGGTVLTYNFIFRNNLIHLNGLAPIVNFAILNGVIEHNTFIAPSPGFAIFASTSNAIISNNIFYNADPVAGTSGCVFNNNISFNTSGTAFGNLGGTNIDNTDPQFVNLATTTLSLTNNYNVSATGSAHNTASDSTDIGYYGGPAIINLTPYGEVYNMPVIRKMEIQNLTVPQTGNVNVKVRSTISRVN